MNIGEKIKVARENAGLTQAKLAAILGVANQMVSIWETGARNPNYKSLNKIASALDISVSELLEGCGGRSYIDTGRKTDLIDKLEDVFDDLYQRADPGMELDKLVTISNAMANIADTLVRLEEA